jgi:hypothetical protein
LISPRTLSCKCPICALVLASDRACPCASDVNLRSVPASESNAV